MATQLLLHVHVYTCKYTHWPGPSYTSVYGLSSGLALGGVYSLRPGGLQRISQGPLS